MRHHGRNLGLTLVALLAAAALGACGGSTKSASSAGNTTKASTHGAAQTVDKAFQADLNQSGLQLDVRVQAAPSVLTSDDSGISAAQAQDILTTHLVVSTHTSGSTPLSSAKATSGGEEIALVKGDTNLADIRVVDSNLYVRADIPSISSDYGLDSGQVAQFRQELNQIATEVPAASALNRGQWVSINVPGAVKAFGGDLGLNPSTTSTTTAAQGMQLVNTLNALFSESASVTGAGGHYVLVFRDKAVANQLGALEASVPGVAAVPHLGSLGQSASSIPASKTTTIDAVITNGKVSQISVPLAQFATHKTLSGPASIVINLSSVGAISAPTGATAVDLGQLGQLIGEAEGASGSSATATASSTPAGA